MPADDKTRNYSKFNLPSRGALYENKIPDGEIEIRHLLFQEEEVLASGGKNMERISKIIDMVSRIPGGVRHEDLLLTDRFAILIATRTMTHGSDYGFQYQCENCKASNRESVNLANDLDEVTPEDAENRMQEAGFKDFKFEEPLTFKLPVAGDVLQVRFLRGTDESLMMSRARKAVLADGKKTDPSFAYRHAISIVAINDRADLPVTAREDYVRKMHAKDSNYFRNYMEKAETGIDLRLVLNCTKCSYENVVALPLTAEFFRPSNLHA